MASRCSSSWPTSTERCTSAGSRRTGKGFMVTFLIHVGVLACISIILAVGCNLILGYGGMYQIGQGAFYAIGAYAGAILSTRTSLPWPVEVVASMAVALVIGLALAWSMVSLHPDFFSLATFGFSIVVFTV